MYRQHGKHERVDTFCLSYLRIHTANDIVVMRLSLLGISKGRFLLGTVFDDKLLACLYLIHTKVIWELRNILYYLSYDFAHFKVHMANYIHIIIHWNAEQTIHKHNLKNKFVPNPYSSLILSLPELDNLVAPLIH